MRIGPVNTVTIKLDDYNKLMDEIYALKHVAIEHINKNRILVDAIEEALDRATEENYSNAMIPVNEAAKLIRIVKGDD